MKQEGTSYRIYPNGEVVHQADFKERDIAELDKEERFTLYFIPDAVLDYIRVDDENPRCSFCMKTKKEIGVPVIKGKEANICYGCVATNKKKLDKEGEKK
jgi:hypothetical protein